MQHFFNIQGYTAMIIHFTEESEVATECSVLYNLYRSPFLRQSFTRSTLTLERPQKKRKKALKLIHRAGPPANTISIPNPFKLTTPFWPAEGNSTINGQAVAKDGVVTCSLWDREVSLGNLHISCKYGNDEELKSRFATDQEQVKSRRESERRPTQEKTGDLKWAGRLAIRHSNSHRSNRNKNMERGGVLHLSTLKIMTLTGLDLCPESSRRTYRCPQHIQSRKEKDLEEDASFHRPAPVLSEDED
ncbi:hypothetical protein CAPTEDRAFT_218281 [Capitella teleta]|uniref:Uncharacterized protein n=1 Tax=Capitella teleta TaxID=283909 RepID=R7TCH9_CAPTE|nr:hypothetical protein CAPTEDRAFT_218281 [Capitella teleta]|eukprot:ELT91433.1 hypothetical protein CAPTEDRAFT_218281 [Capitella teleta]